MQITHFGSVTTILEGTSIGRDREGQTVYVTGNPYTLFIFFDATPNSGPIRARISELDLLNTGTNESLRLGPKEGEVIKGTRDGVLEYGCSFYGLDIGPEGNDVRVSGDVQLFLRDEKNPTILPITISLKAHRTVYSVGFVRGFFDAINGI